jgi:phosphatidylinositol alpha-mannosyltransferase
MRIALIAEDYYPQLGGIPEHVHAVAQEYRALGHEVTIIASHMRGNHQDPAYVRRLGTSIVFYFNGGVSRTTAGWRLTERLANLLRELRTEIVHVHAGLTPTWGIVGHDAADRVGIPFVATFHSWFPRSYLLQLFRVPLQRRLDRHAAAIAVSKAAAEAMDRYFTTKWDIIPNGVDTNRFHANGRSPTKTDTRNPRLLFFHRLEPRNHLGTLIEALPRIIDRYPGAELTVAGDGPWRGFYERKAAPLGNKIKFIGRVASPPELFREHDLYLCPSTRQSFGIALLESMASGTPMIVGDNAGFRSVVDGGGEAEILPHDHPRAWADKAIELIGDPVRRQAMREAGLKKVQRYAWPRVAREVLAVYERVLAKSK